MEKAKSIIFYSWQSDLPSKTNRNFILQALENAARALRQDISSQFDPIIDRDTKDVPGSPGIAKTILGKIDQSQAFVCDISIINQDAMARPTPNPNVLIELGYALKALGEHRIVMVLNETYGGLSLLPFDLHTYRIATYRMSEDEGRADERKRLESIFKDALSTILSNLDASPPEENIIPLAEQALIAIKENRRDQAALVRDYMSDLAESLPLITSDASTTEMQKQLIQVLQDSKGRVIEFSRLAKGIAEMKADEAAEAMYGGFASIIDAYKYPPDFQGMIYEFAHDCAKFLGHELFVIFFSFLIHNERWELIVKLLDQNLYPRNLNFGYSGVPFSHLAENPWLLYEDHREHLRTNTRSLHADLLKERHTKGDLAKIVPMEQFMGADFFLFLRAPLGTVQTFRTPVWMPWSSLHMQYMPRYLQEAKRAEKAGKLLVSLKVKDISTLRVRLVEYGKAIAGAWGPGPMTPLNYALRNFDFDAIGSC